MADIARKVAYFALDVPNKPGEGARILGALADAGVNLLAFSGFPNGRKSQLDIIPEDVNVFRKAVRIMQITTRPQKFGFLIQEGCCSEYSPKTGGQKNQCNSDRRCVSRCGALCCYPLG